MFPGHWALGFNKNFNDYGIGLGQMSCPGCGKKISATKPYPVIVNIGKSKVFWIDNMWGTDTGCNNPLCKWSELSND